MSGKSRVKSACGAQLSRSGERILRDTEQCHQKMVTEWQRARCKGQHLEDWHAMSCPAWDSGSMLVSSTGAPQWPCNHWVRESNLVDSASSHTLVSKIKPCMSKYNSFTLKTANGSLYQMLPVLHIQQLPQVPTKLKLQHQLVVKKHQRTSL